MKVTFLPRTLAGKCSVWSIAAFVILFGIFLLLVASGQRGGETFLSNLVLSVPMLLAGISGVAAFFSGLAGVIWKRERSVLVFLAVFIGLFVLIFWLGEVTSPH